MAGISGMTLPLARALGRFGIRVVSILPGLFDTPEMKEYEDTVMVMSKMTPFPRRLGVPEEFAHLVEVASDHPLPRRRSSATPCSTAVTFDWTAGSGRSTVFGCITQAPAISTAGSRVC